MNGINKAIIVGTLGADPESRYTPNGTAIASFRVATNEEWNDKQTGEKKSRAEWHRIEAFGKLAEICGEYLKKGSQVYIEGKLRTDEYEKDGVKRYSTKIIANEMQMLGGKPEGSAQPPRSTRQQPPTHDEAPVDEDEIPFVTRDSIW